MKSFFVALIVLILLTEKGWSEELKGALGEKPKIAGIDVLLSCLKNSDMASFKRYCDGDSLKMIDSLYCYAQSFNRDSLYWYFEYNCKRSIIDIPFKREDAIKCASYKLKAYFWMIKISKGLMDDDDRNICQFYEKEEVVYDQLVYYDIRKSAFVTIKCDNRRLDKKFRKWYQSVKRGGIDRAQKELQKISYEIELRCK